MSRAADAAAAIARAMLYEGYLLYPYRASNVKNRRRWTLGAVLPRVWCEVSGTADRWRIATEVIARGDGTTAAAAVIRFLRGGAEETIELPPRALGRGGVAERHHAGAIAVDVERDAIALGDGLWRIMVAVANSTPIDVEWSRDEALGFALGSAHVVVEVVDGGLVSAIDPPSDAAAAVAGCAQDGLWPALLGPTSVLAAPIVLPDHPEVAPESPGDLFDATEIDEILILRIMTMTEAEKREARAGDAHAAALIDRCEALGPDAVLALHGRRRAAPVSIGDRVTLRPRPRGDVIDGVLAGRAATVIAVEHDLDGRVHVAVTVDDDPGADLGAAGYPAHRFFFAVDEVELR